MGKTRALFILLFAVATPVYSFGQNDQFLNSFGFVNPENLKILNEVFMLLDQKSKTKKYNASSSAKQIQTSNKVSLDTSSSSDSAFEEDVRNFLNKSNLKKSKKIFPKIKCLNYKFTKILKLGDYNDEVYYVQKFLNQNPQTRVAEKGAGSLGKETKYFGRKTFEAVKRFQEMAKKFILEPIGFEKPTGFWGSSTISFANKLTSVCRK